MIGICILYRYLKHRWATSIHCTMSFFAHCGQCLGFFRSRSASRMILVRSVGEASTGYKNCYPRAKVFCCSVSSICSWLLEYSEEGKEWVNNSQSTARVSCLFICLVCVVPEDMLEYSEESEEWVKNSQSTARVSSLSVVYLKTCWNTVRRVKSERRTASVWHRSVVYSYVLYLMYLKTC